MPRRLTEWEKMKVLERQNYKCAMCGKSLKRGVVHFDHKKPLALGGKDDLRNIQALCPECHHIKTKRDRHLIAKAGRKEKEEKKIKATSPLTEISKIEKDILSAFKSIEKSFGLGDSGKKKKKKKSSIL